MSYRDKFAGRQVFLVAVVIGVLLALPTLFCGLFLDDYQQRIAVFTGGRNLFEFFHRGTAATEALMQNGVLPWWTHPATKVMFYRPVAQWLIELDYWLWPDSLLLMHLHSVFWYGLAVFAAGISYRQMMPTRWAAGLAAILFAVDAAHGPAVAWLANRNAMVCMSGALMALLCYRQRHWYWHVAGCALFGFSLGCGEATLAISGYLFAYEVCLSERPWYQRVLRLLPYALIAVAWLAFWKVRGFGTSGPGFYIDPGSDPRLFLQNLVYRYPAYLVGQLFLPPAELFGLAEGSDLRIWGLIYALAILALLAWLLLPLLRSSRLARFYGLGMLVAVIPICGSATVSRSLWFVGFGATGLLALFIEQFRGLSLSPARLRASAAFAGTMMVLHLWISPLLFLVYGRTGDIFDALMDSRHVQLPDNGTPGAKVLAISAQTYVGDITFPLLKDQAFSLGAAPRRQAPSIERIRALTEGSDEFELLHEDADTLVISRATGFKSLRPVNYPFAAGEKIVLDDVEIQVQAVTPGGAPTLIEYRFHPGVLASYEVIAWSRDHFIPSSLPPVGTTVQIKTDGT